MIIKTHYDKLLCLLSLLFFVSVFIKYAQSNPIFDPALMAINKGNPKELRVDKKPQSPQQYLLKKQNAFSPKDKLSVWKLPSYPEKLFQTKDSHSLPAPFITEIFTPPEIYYSKKNKTWTLLSSLHPGRLNVPFDLKIGKITRRLYRFQYQGFIKNPGDRNQEKYSILFKDIKTGQKFIKRKGEPFPQDVATLKSVVIEHNKNAGNYLKKKIQATLVDKSSGKTITLGSEKPAYTDEFIIQLYSTKKPENQFEWNKVGDSIQIEKVKYTLNKIDLTNKELLVEKQFLESAKSALHKLPIPDTFDLQRASLPVDKNDNN